MTNVQGRWGAQLLINASNPQNSGATTLDSTRLGNAIADVEAAFKVLCGTTYDDTDDRHVMYAVEGVMVRLLVLTGQASRTDWKDWRREIRSELAKVTGRDRIIPSTTSGLTVTPDKPGEHPQMDRGVFDGHMIPGSPGGGSSDRTLGDS